MWVQLHCVSAILRKAIPNHGGVDGDAESLHCNELSYPLFYYFTNEKRTLSEHTDPSLCNLPKHTDRVLALANLPRSG